MSRDEDEVKGPDPIVGACSVASDSFATPWIVAHQAPPFPRQEYYSGLPFPSPGDLPDPGIKLRSCTAGIFFTTEPPECPLSR